MSNSTNNVREIRTRLSLDGETAFRRSLKSVDSSLSAMRSELKNVSANFDESTSSMTKNQKKAEILGRMQDTLKVKIGALADAVETSTKEYEDARKKAEDLTAEYGEQSDKAKAAWQEVETLGNKMDRMTTMANNAQSKLADVTQQLRDLETPLSDVDSNADDVTKAFEDVEEASRNAGKAAEDAGNGGFTIMKGAAANLVSEGLSVVYDNLKNIVTEFGSMDSVYNNFAIKTGASAKEMEGYSESIMSLYKDGYADSLGGVSDSMAVVKQSLGDVPTKKIEEVTEYAITLEEALGYDVAESMRTVNTLADQFGVTYSNAFDLIIQGAQNGLDQNGDLLDVINEYSVQFKNSGYDAEEMFNMLANGAAEGVWSVDKLGDSMKEFNIRLSDGTADEALQALGLGFSESAADAELMERAAFGVSKAQVSLAEAQAEAAGVLAESGENSLEYQKALNDVTQAEYDLADAESAYNAAANATNYNLDEIKGKLSAGGYAAQEAQQQIITALMSVEDENERYILGQQLMGTMWEDLGEDAIAAMYNTQGKISTTKDAMQEVIDLKYDDIGTRLEKVGRKAKTEIAEPLIEKWMPKIEDGIEWVSDNLDDLVPIVEKVGGAMLVAFGVKKAVGFGTGIISGVKSISSVVSALTTKTIAQTAAQTALNATNPFGWAVLAVGALTAVGVGLAAANAAEEKAYAETVERFASLTDEEQKLRDATNEVIDEYNDWNETRNNLAQDTSTEFGYYDELWNELQGIVDQNGAVKEGYEDRAAFITDQLGAITGTEIQITDGVIQKYDELSESIDELLLKKKAEAMQSAFEDSYTKAITNRSEAYQTMVENQETLEEQTAELSAAEQEYIAVRAEVLRSMGLSEDALTESGDAVMYAGREIKLSSDTLDAAKAKVEGLTKKTEEQAAVTEESELAYTNYIATIENYEGLSAAIISGDVTSINNSLTFLEKGFITANTGTEEQLEEQTENYKTELQNLKQAIKDGVPGVTQEQVHQMEVLVASSERELAHAGAKYKTQADNAMGEYHTGIVEGTALACDAAANARDATVGELSSGTGSAYNAGWDTGTSYSDGLNAALSDMVVETDHGTTLWAPALAMGKKIPQFANGVDNFRGGFAVINENDRGELVNLPNGSQVIPHDISLKYAEEAAAHLGAATNNFGGITVQINNPSLSGEQDVKATAIQLSEAVISEISRRIDSQKRRYSSAVGR